MMTRTANRLKRSSKVTAKARARTRERKARAKAKTRARAKGKTRAMAKGKTRERKARARARANSDALPKLRPSIVPQSSTALGSETYPSTLSARPEETDV